MKFSTEYVASAAEIDSARLSTGRTTTIAKIVVMVSAVVLFALVYPFGKWLAGHVTPLSFSNEQLSPGVLLYFQSALLVLFGSLAFLSAGISLARWPFARAIALYQTLQPLEDYEASTLVKIAAANPKLDEYRRSVAATREFVKGDFELIFRLDQDMKKAVQEAERARARQETFAKLHSVE